MINMSISFDPSARMPDRRGSPAGSAGMARDEAQRTAGPGREGRGIEWDSTLWPSLPGPAVRGRVVGIRGPSSRGGRPSRVTAGSHQIMGGPVVVPVVAPPAVPVVEPRPLPLSPLPAVTVEPTPVVPVPWPVIVVVPLPVPVPPVPPTPSSLPKPLPVVPSAPGIPVKVTVPVPVPLMRPFWPVRPPFPGAADAAAPEVDGGQLGGRDRRHLGAERVEAAVVPVPELGDGGLLARELGAAGVGQLAGGRLGLGLGRGPGGAGLRDGRLHRSAGRLQRPLGRLGLGRDAGVDRGQRVLEGGREVGVRDPEGAIETAETAGDAGELAVELAGERAELPIHRDGELVDPGVGRGRGSRHVGLGLLGLRGLTLPSRAAERLSAASYCASARATRRVSIVWIWLTCLWRTY